MDAYAANPAIFFRRGDGTGASPSALQSGDIIGSVSALGMGATQFSTTLNAAVEFIAAENWTNTAQGTYIDLVTTAAGTTTHSVAVQIFASGGVGIGETGTDPGAKNEIVAGWMASGGSAIASLPTCNSTSEGGRYYVTNGVSSPALGATVSTTGSTWQPVTCNGANWVYGYLLDRDVDPIANDNVAPAGLRLAA
jgi:hypothetical protein